MGLNRPPSVDLLTEEFEHVRQERAQAQQAMLQSFVNEAQRRDYEAFHRTPPPHPSRFHRASRWIFKQLRKRAHRHKGTPAPQPPTVIDANYVEIPDETNPKTTYSRKERHDERR